MKHELNRYDITLIIAQARRKRSDATGDLIASTVGKGLTWINNRAGRVLHVLLMSPANTR